MVPLSRLPLRAARRMKHSLPDLAFDYDALEPVIAAEIMKLHHSRHHAAYVNNLNVAEERSAEALAKGNVKEAIGLQPALKFNGGGHINHSIFWTNLCGGEAGEPSAELRRAIDRDFGSLAAMQDRVSSAAVAVHGSGWAWLALCPSSKRLRVAACANQDPLEPTTGLIPLFGIDVWEHAYYLQYKNARPDYAKAIWKVANWRNVSERFANACK